MAEHGYRDAIYSAYLKSSDASDLAALQAAHDSRRPYLKNLIRRHFPKDTSVDVLDLGCGSGALIATAKQLGYWQVRGVDYSKEQVEAAGQLGVVGVEEGDCFAYLRQLPDASQDVIVAFDIIEHLSKNELLCFVKEVWRVLRPNGRWIMHTPNAESPFFGRIRYGDMTHELAFTQVSIRQLLLTLGFSHISVYEDQPTVHGVVSAVRYVLWRLVRSALSLYLMAETGERRGIFSQNLLAVAIKHASKKEASLW